MGAEPQALLRGRVLDLACDAVEVDRQDTHGDAREGLAIVAAIWSARLGVEITPAQVCLMMVDLKTVRAWGNPVHGDNWVDIAGWGALGGELAGAMP